MLRKCVCVTLHHCLECEIPKLVKFIKRYCRWMDGVGSGYVGSSLPYSRSVCNRPMDNSVSPIYLNNETVKELLDWDQIVPLIEQCMINISYASKVIQPVRTIMRIPSKDGLLLTMPAFSEPNDALGCKLVTSFPKNKEKHLPSVLATIVLNDCNSGQVFAIMDGTEITAWRTAAASIVGTKYLHFGPKNILSILGAGTQARSHAMGMQHIFNFKEVRIWNRTRARAEQLANELLKNGISVTICPTVDSCVKNADVIVTAIYATEPILKYGWVKSDAMISAVGAGYSHHSEIDEELYHSSIVYVDNNEAAKSELKGLKDFGVNVEGELGDVIMGKINVKQGVINIFHALGMAVEDVTTAKLVYEEYKNKKQ